MSIKNDVAIIGMAGRFPKADTLDQYWNNILNQVNSTTYFSPNELRLKTTKIGQTYVAAKPCLEGVEYFDAHFFGFSNREAQYLDPQIRVFLEVAYHALEDAAYYTYGPPHNVGVFAGASTSVEWYRKLFRNQKPLTLSESFEAWILSCKDFLSQILSYRLNLIGPSYTIYTACSTSLATIHLACQSLLMNECQMALAGGVTIDLPLREGYLYEKGMIHSPDGICRPFDDSANGTVFGDGAGAIVLKKLDQALKDCDRIYAIIKGSQCNNDGRRKTGFVAPSIEGQKEVLKTTYLRSDIPLKSIQYIEVHGTGTKIGDPVEFEGLLSVYAHQKESSCALGSVKANMGHLHAAAGIAGLIKTVLAIKNKTIPPITHFEKPNQELRLKDSSFYFPCEVTPWKKKRSFPRRAAISSFGVGGTNVHVVIEELSTVSTKKAIKSLDKSYFFPLSAKSPEALQSMIKQFFDFIEKHPDIDLESVEYTLEVGRESFAYRKLLKADSRDSFLKLKPGPDWKADSVGGCDCPLILFCTIGTEIDSDLFKKRLKNPELSDFNKMLQETLEKYLPEKVRKRVLAILRLNTAPASNQEMKLALFIYHLIQMKSLLSLGFTPHIFLGSQEGVYLAAILARQNHVEEIFFAYLYDLHKEWIKEKNRNLQKTKQMIAQHSLENVSVCYSNSYAQCLIYGNFAESVKEKLSRHYQKIHFLSTSLDFDRVSLKTLLGQLWEGGVTIHWKDLYKNRQIDKISLPHYPFDKQRCWIEEASGDHVDVNPSLHMQKDRKISATVAASLVREIFLEILQVPSLKNDDHFFRLGGDSLQLTQVVSKVNQEFNIEIELEEVYRMPTMTKVLELLINKQIVEV